MLDNATGNFRFTIRNDSQIQSLRDLEDFARLWVNVSGLHAGLVDGTFKLGLKWKSHGALKPAIKVYPAAARAVTLLIKCSINLLLKIETIRIKMTPTRTPAMPSKPASYDLHNHTHWSYDAFAHAENYFKKAHELGVRCFAITEHHNLDGVHENLELARQYPDIRFIIAAELSVALPADGGVDLLAYGLPAEPTGLLREVLDEYHEWQRAYGHAFSEMMVKAGFPYDDEARRALLEAYRPKHILDVQGTTHVRHGIQLQYFIDKGYIKSIEDLRQIRAETTVKFPRYPDAKRVTTAVKEAGGLVVQAHPSHYLRANLDLFEVMIRELQLDGIECAHPSASPELTKLYRAYCKEYGLVSTAGSDNHTQEGIAAASEIGAKNAEAAISHGSFAGHIGEDAWLDEFLERLDQGPQ